MPQTSRDTFRKPFWKQIASTTAPCFSSKNYSDLSIFNTKKASINEVNILITKTIYKLQINILNKQTIMAIKWLRIWNHDCLLNFYKYSLIICTQFSLWEYLPHISIRFLRIKYIMQYVVNTYSTNCQTDRNILSNTAVFFMKYNRFMECNICDHVYLSDTVSFVE